VVLVGEVAYRFSRKMNPAADLHGGPMIGFHSKSRRNWAFWGITSRGRGPARPGDAKAAAQWRAWREQLWGGRGAIGHGFA